MSPGLYDNSKTVAQVQVYIMGQRVPKVQGKQRVPEGSRSENGTSKVQDIQKVYNCQRYPKGT